MHVLAILKLEWIPGMFLGDFHIYTFHKEVHEQMSGSHVTEAPACHTTWLLWRG